MRIYCPKCEAFRDTVFKCVEIIGKAAARFVQVCAVCSAVLSSPIDDLHTQKEPDPQPPITIERVISTSVTTTANPHFIGRFKPDTYARLPLYRQGI